jgi:FAD:protein FMN transferase
MITETQPEIAPRARVFHHACQAMGTRFAMVLPEVDNVTGERLAEMAERNLRAQQRLMSRFDANSPVSELNRRADAGPVAPPGDLWNILHLCREHWRRTRGAFDITQLPLHELWRESLSRDEVPSPEVLANTLARTGFERVRLDETARSVSFETPGVRIDLGGFGKGYALEQLAESFKAQGVERAFFSFGESSVTVIGSHPNGPPWPVGIVNLFQPANPVHTFNLQDASVSTSGTAPFNQMGGWPALGHVINPRDGRPIAGYRTMSAASPSAADAEVLSTALLVTPVEERAEILAGYAGASAVEVVYEQRHNHFVPNIAWRQAS